MTLETRERFLWRFQAFGLIVSVALISHFAGRRLGKSVPIHAGPGEEAQFDVCDLDLVAADWEWARPLRCFGAILSWSRRRMWWFTASADQNHTFEGLARAFECFGGVPAAARTDRMGALGCSQGHRFKLHGPAMHFAAHYGTKITRVPGEGFEPSHPRGRRSLSPLRLPVPPSGLEPRAYRPRVRGPWRPHTSAASRGPSQTAVHEGPSGSGMPATGIPTRPDRHQGASEGLLDRALACGVLRPTGAPAK